LEEGDEHGMPEPVIHSAGECLGLDVVDFDRAMAFMSGQLRPSTKPLGLSLGDRACIVLGLQLDVRVLTAEHLWSRLDVGIDIQVIRLGWFHYRTLSAWAQVGAGTWKARGIVRRSLKRCSSRLSPSWKRLRSQRSVLEMWLYEVSAGQEHVSTDELREHAGQAQDGSGQDAEEESAKHG